MRLPPFPLVDWFAAAEGRFDLSLSHSDCEPLGVADLFDADEWAALSNLRLGYGTFAGEPELRECVARQYGTMRADDVLVFAGASEAIYTFMRAMLDPGDEVVVQCPAFNTLYAIAQAVGCRVLEWRPADEVACAFDVSRLVELCNERTKLIVVNFPHNPSGRMISEGDLRRIVETARRFDAFLFSDEQFRLLELPSTSTLPAACDLYEKAVSVAGVSKTHGLGGLRIGWLATRCREVIKTAREYRYCTTEMTNTPCQILARRALERSAAILTRNRSRIAANVERLESFAERHGDKLLFHRPAAGTMGLVELKIPVSGMSFCEQLLEKERVFLVPGSTMRLPDQLLRFGFGREDFSQGLDRLDSFLQDEVK